MEILTSWDSLKLVISGNKDGVNSLMRLLLHTPTTLDYMY